MTTTDHPTGPEKDYMQTAEGGEFYVWFSGILNGWTWDCRHRDLTKVFNSARDYPTAADAWRAAWEWDQARKKPPVPAWWKPGAWYIVAGCLDVPHCVDRGSQFDGEFIPIPPRPEGDVTWMVPVAGWEYQSAVINTNWITYTSHERPNATLPQGAYRWCRRVTQQTDELANMKIKRLQDELASVREHRERLDKALSGSRAQCERLQTSLADANAENNVLHATLENIDREVKRAGGAE